jgi:hypothetical protein
LTLLVSLPEGFINPSKFCMHKSYHWFFGITHFWWPPNWHSCMYRHCWTCSDICPEPQWTVVSYNLEHLQYRE